LKSLPNDAEQAVIVNHDAMRSIEPWRAAEVVRLIQAGGVHRETVRRIRKEQPPLFPST